MTWSRSSGRDAGTSTVTWGQAVPWDIVLSSDQSGAPGVPKQPHLLLQGSPLRGSPWDTCPLSELQAHRLTSDLPPCTSPLPSPLIYPSHISFWEAADPLSILHLQQEGTWGRRVSTASLATCPTWEVGKREQGREFGISRSPQPPPEKVTSLVVQWLWTSIAGAPASIPGRGLDPTWHKLRPRAAKYIKKKKKKN